MNSLVRINNKDLSVKEFQGQRVITFQDIDMLHERPEGTAKRNFAENKDRFTKDIDYFEVSTKFVPTMEQYGFSKFAASGTLITESGYLMLVKSLTDDLAWEVQRQLINTYFRARQISGTLDNLSPQLQLLISMELKQKEMEQKQEVLEHRINNLDATNIEGTPRQRLNDMVRKYAYDNGVIYAEAWKAFRRHFNTAYRTNIELKRNNFMATNNIKRLSYPDYMERTGLIDDALRIADKMLNKAI